MTDSSGGFAHQEPPPQEVAQQPAVAEHRLDPATTEVVLRRAFELARVEPERDLVFSRSTLAEIAAEVDLPVQAVATALALVAVALVALGAQYRTWAMISLLPLNFAGLALVHARAKGHGQGTGWLTGFYLAWLFLDLVKLMVVFAAIADSWFDFRQRWTKSSNTDVSKREDD